MAREREERRRKEAERGKLTDRQREIWWREKLARSGGHVVGDALDLEALRREAGPSSEIIPPPNIAQSRDRASTTGNRATRIGPRRRDREE